MKSDDLDTVLSATEASRSFSAILDRVEQGERFLVERHGRRICLLAPPPTTGRTATECLEILQARAPVLLDDRFGADLLDIIAGEPGDDRPVGLLIDSTVLIHAERTRQSPEGLVGGLLERFGDLELALSVMSAGELFHGCGRAETAERRARREEFIESVLAAVPALPITLPIVRIFGRLDAQLRADGHPLPTSDLLIACTALSRGDDVVTGNLRHFALVPGLTVHSHPPQP